MRLAIETGNRARDRLLPLLDSTVRLREDGRFGGAGAPVARVPRPVQHLTRAVFTWDLHHLEGRARRTDTRVAWTQRLSMSFLGARKVVVQGAPSSVEWRMQRCTLSPDGRGLFQVSYRTMGFKWVAAWFVLDS